VATAEAVAEVAEVAEVAAVAEEEVAVAAASW
jgi:hypothetical protein